MKKSLEKSPLKVELEKRSRQILDEAEKILKWGHPVEEILKTAEEEKVDIIVLGSRGLSSAQRFL